MKQKKSLEIEIVVSRETDPYVNLAIEEYLFWRQPADKTLLLFYINDPAVISGKHQNPWRECDLSLLEEKEIPFLRRFTGGGTVYHDQGNLNFSFINPLSGHSPESNLEMITESLKRLGIIAARKGKHDLYVVDRKISGNAFALKKQRAIHHGTLLVNADLYQMMHLLNPTLEMIKGTGTLSRRAQVINMEEVHTGLTAKRLLERMVSYLVDEKEVISVHCIDKNALASEEVEDLLIKYHSWQWNFGQTPDFSVTFTSQMESKPVITVHRGRVEEIKYTAFELKNEFIGQPFSETLLRDIETRIVSVPVC